MKYLLALVALMVWCAGCDPKPPTANSSWVDQALLDQYPDGWRETKGTFYVDICFQDYKQHFDALDGVMEPLNNTITFVWDKGTIDQNKYIPWIICDNEPIGDWIGASWGGRGIRLKMEWLEKETDVPLIRHVILHEIWHQFGIGHVPDDGISLMSPIATGWNILTKADLDAWTANYGTANVDFETRPPTKDWEY